MVNTGYSKEQADSYDTKRFTTPQGRLFDQLEKQRFRSFFDGISQGSKVLEVGCGTGRFTDVVSSTGYELVATDMSPYMLEKTRERTYNEAAYAQVDASDLPFDDGQFDFVYSIRVLNQLSSEKHAYKTLEEFVRVCAPGGKILVEFMNENSLSRFSSDNPVLLTPERVERTITATGSAEVINLTGILIGSQTLLNHTPPILLPAYKWVDANLCQLIPQYATRCYALIKVDQ